jgi:hypothetical protein
MSIKFGCFVMVILFIYFLLVILCQLKANVTET